MALAAEMLFARQKPSNSKPQHDSLSKVVDKHFTQWDRNHDKLLDIFEVDHVIEDRSVHGRLAGFIVCVRYHLTDKNNSSTLSHPQLLKLVDEKKFFKSFEQNVKRLETIDRELFLPTDPDLNTFNQGRLNDCYLLSPIAAQAQRNPKAIREMIHPEVTGGFKVVYGDGQKIHVPPLTDSELLLGARLDHRHGSWLAVLEKSYGIIRKQKHEKHGTKPDPKNGSEAIQQTNWGGAGEILTLLTGHRSESLNLHKASIEETHNLLRDQWHKKHLLTVSKNADKGPPGIGTRHAYAILSYDSQKRQVHVFNPWGNNFTPKGPDGPTHGFTTKNGHFHVSLDHFHSVFTNVVYETGQPVHRTVKN